MDSFKITLPQTKKVIEIREWITGRERIELSKILASKVEIQAGGGAEVQDPNILFDLQKKQLELFVLNVDGEPTDYEKLLDLPDHDYQFILKEVSKKMQTPDLEE